MCNRWTALLVASKTAWYVVTSATLTVNEYMCHIAPVQRNVPTSSVHTYITNTPLQDYACTRHVSARGYTPLNKRIIAAVLRPSVRGAA